MAVSRPAVYLAFVGILLTSFGGLAEGAEPAQLGWFHGNCLAIKGNALATGDEVTVVDPDKPKSVSKAVVLRRAEGADNCFALSEDRKTVNVDEGHHFFEVESAAELNLAIGIVGKAHIAGSSHASLTDMNGDGVGDVFDYCYTSEGVSFTVRDKASKSTEPLWQGYYYLGYDVEPTCPIDK